MDTATPTANGSVAPVEASPLEQIRERARLEMEELLAPLAARRGQLEAELASVIAEQEEIRTTMTALMGKAPAQKKKTKPLGTHGPSLKMLDDVYAYIATCGQPDVIKDELCAGLGISQSTAMDALRTLRETERIRIVGTRKAADDTRTGGRAPSAYAVMPNG